jgi:broad specificity phosphatase PhoE
MTTTKIMLIRHAEKPNGEQGVMPDGTINAEALTPTGWRRAKALVGLFDPPGGGFANPHLATPRAIFASGAGHHDGSLRPQQTVAPLATTLDLQVDTDYRKGREGELVAAATAAGGVVLIAWQHEAIPQIADLIRGDPSGIPQTWPGGRFDIVWIFDRLAGGGWSFVQVPQRLLPDDSSNLIPVT